MYNYLKKPFAGKISAAAVLILLVSLFTFSMPAVASSINIEIDTDSVNEDETVYVSFPGQNESIRFFVYEQTGEDEYTEIYASTIASPEDYIEEYHVQDFLKVLGGDSLVLYFAAVPESELEGFDDDNNNLETVLNGGVLTTSWDKPDASTGEFTFEDVSLVRDIIVRDVTAVNSSPSAPSPYAVTEDDEVEITFFCNAGTIEISASSLEDADNITWTPSGTRDSEGFESVTGVAKVPKKDVADNSSGILKFDFTVNGIYVDQDSELVNADQPDETLTYYAPLNEDDLIANIFVDTQLEDGYVTVGDTITLEYGEIERDFYFTVKELRIGSQAVTTFEEDGISVSFEMISNAKITDLSALSLKITDEVGGEYTLSIINGEDYQYIEPPSKEENTISITGDMEYSAAPSKHYAVFSDSIVTYSLHTNNIYANMQYQLEIKIGDDEYKTIDMVRAKNASGEMLGDPVDGYKFTADLDMRDVENIIHGDKIAINRILRGEDEVADIGYDNSLKTTDFIYYSPLKFASIDISVDDSTISNTPGADADGKVYAVYGDCVFFEAELNQQVNDDDSFEISIAKYKGEKVSITEIEEYLDDISSFDEAGKLIYSLDSAAAKVTGLFRFPKLSGGSYSAEISAAIEITATPYSLEEKEYTIASNKPKYVAEDADPYHKLFYWNPVNPDLFSIYMETNSSLEKAYIHAGDSVSIFYEGITASYIERLEAGERVIDYTDPKPGISGNHKFNLTKDNTEEYLNNERISILFYVANDAGKIYPVELPKNKSYRYVIPPIEEENRLSVKFYGTHYINDEAPGYYAVTHKSSLGFTFSSNYIFIEDYTLTLTTDSGASFDVPLSLDDSFSNSPITGYTYTGFARVEDFEALKDYNRIKITIKRNSKSINFTDNLNGADIIYFGDFYLTGMQVSYPASGGELLWEPEDEYAYVIDNDFIVITLTFNHSLIPKETVLQMDNLTGVQKSKAVLTDYIKYPYRYKQEMQLTYYFDETNYKNDTIVCLFRMPSRSDKNYDEQRLSFQSNGSAYADVDNVPFEISMKSVRHAVPDEDVIVDTGDYEAKKQNEKELYHKMVYWAPLDVWNPEIELINLAADVPLPIDDLSEETYVIVRDGQDIRVSFVTKHPIVIDDIITKYSTTDSPQIALTYTETLLEQTRFLYTAAFTIGTSPLSNMDDLTIIRLLWEVNDIRGQANKRNINYSRETKWAIYYKPLEITEVTISSSNMKDGTQYCKDEDTITVEFVANHYVMLESSIIGKSIETEDTRNRRQQEFSFLYKLENGDLEDLADVEFSFEVEDLAGDTFEFTEASDGVINKLMYYAPMEVTADIESSNSNPVYARNGDTVTVSTTTNHEAQTLDFRLGSREIGDNDIYREDPSVSYRIPENEETLNEGDLFFSVRVEDPAGNYELVNETAPEGEEGTKVTYDRTPPEIRILPGFNGYTNQDVSFTFVFNDMHLDLSTLSCRLNGAQRIRHPGGTETSYSHDVALTEEGEYYVQATVSDMAGNEMEFEAVCHLIIDKTEPVILLDLKPNTFKAGFTLEKIINIEEDNLGEIVCTITDNEGVREWDFNTPIEDEGKKTIYAMARDMAGNTSTPIIYDVFIDATAPLPQVTNSANGEALKPQGKNVLVGSSASVGISLAPIHMGDEKPDKFTTLQIVDANGKLLFDFLASDVQEHKFTYKLPDFGTYTLLAAAVDDVGNTEGPLLYVIEFREKYFLERMLENTPLSQIKFIQRITDLMFVGICLLFVSTLAGLAMLIAHKRKKRQEYMEQDYVIIDEE